MMVKMNIVEIFSPRALPDVHYRRVDEDKGDDQEGYAQSSLPVRDGHSTRSRRDQHKDTGCVRATLRVDVSMERHRDHVSCGHEHQHKRPRRPCPLRSHPEAREVAGNQVQEFCHAEAPANARIRMC